MAASWAYVELMGERSDIWTVWGSLAASLDSVGLMRDGSDIPGHWIQYLYLLRLLLVVWGRYNSVLGLCRTHERRFRHARVLDTVL